jgi:nucleotide-binding universal stress UspA family protein
VTGYGIVMNALTALISAGGVMSPFKTIVVAVDFSQTTQDTIDAALDLAWLHQGHVHLVHVVPDPFRLPYTIEPTGVNWTDVLRQWTDEARARLEQLVTNRVTEAVGLTRTIVSGTPATEIVRYARDCSADVIVLGSHGHGLMERLVLGSVAERVIRHATCSVLIVPHEMRLTRFEVQAAGIGALAPTMPITSAP